MREVLNLVCFFPSYEFSLKFLGFFWFRLLPDDREVVLNHFTHSLGIFAQVQALDSALVVDKPVKLLKVFDWVELV